MTNKDKEAAEEDWKELERDTAHVGDECTGDNLERKAKPCQETLSKVLDAKVKETKICARSKRW